MISSLRRDVFLGEGQGVLGKVWGYEGDKGFRGYVGRDLKLGERVDKASAMHAGSRQYTPHGHAGGGFMKLLDDRVGVGIWV